MTAAHRELTPDLERRLKSQIDAWRQDLMNLDRRQKLVYFKHTKTASLEISSPEPEAAVGALSSVLRVVSAEGAGSAARSLVVEDKTDAEVQAACRLLDRQSQQVYADRGFWTLYLGLGMLQWVDPADGKTACAPVVLCPIVLSRSGTQAPYFASLNDDDIVVNPALRLHLEKNFSIDMPGLALDDPDVSSVLNDLRAATADRSGWEVQSRTVLTTFSFHKEAIYRDLHEHESSVTSHPIVQLVALGGSAPSAETFRFTAPGSGSTPIDDEKAPEELVSILDADSSQRACILAARDGKSFVMDGPPGTGKSQTISNIIAELVSAGRRVLFVSEKAAALDVVRDRLADKQLGDFLLELHSHAATRKEVVKQLDDALTQRVTARGAFTDGDKRALQSTRVELTAYAEAMNETRPAMERSLFSVLGRLVALEPHAHKPLENPGAWANLQATQLDELLEIGSRLSHAWRPITEGDDFLWRDLALASHTKSDVDHAKAATSALHGAAKALIERSRAVDEDLELSWPLDLRSARRRLALLLLLEARPDVPVTWMTAPDTLAIADHITTRRRAVDEHSEATLALANIVGLDRVDSVDPDTCAALATDPPLDLVWRPNPKTDAEALRGAVELLANVPLDFAQLVADVRQLGSMLGISTDRVTLRRAEELGHLGALGGAAALPERAWFNPAVQAALDESMLALSSVVELVNERRAAIEQVFTAAALDVDLQGLDIRFRETHTGLRALSSAARADKKQLKAITANSKADRAVRARLGEAVAWQRAEQSLTAAERQHASRLGSYYERTNTDFGRISDAIATARRAIELAGNDLNGGPLATQLGRDGHPDPRLIVIAQRVLDTVSAWRDAADKALGADAATRLSHEPLDLAAVEAEEAARQLAPALSSLEHVTHAAGKSVTLDEGRRARSHAVRLNKALVAIYDSFDDDVIRLGPAYSGLTTDWGHLEKGLDWTDEVRSLLGGQALERQAQRMLTPVVLSDEFRPCIASYETARDRWTALFTSSRAVTLGEDLDSDLPDAVELLAEMRDTCVTDLDEWDSYVQSVTALNSAGMGDSIEHLRTSKAGATEVVPTLEWAILQAWCEATISADHRLSLHRAVDRDARVERFRALDEAQVRQANVSVAALCSARRPGSMAGSAAQLIRRESQKKSRHLPIRDLLARTHEIVQELKPCFMMSPLSVSQFLPGEMTFDTVIFDEASQVLPADAVNCIYRGAQLIVAGDEKQLPPTSFFAQATSDEDVDEELDIFESVLTSCKSALPSLPLTWHYRSQHESLITYSNYRFYAPDGDALQTFPGATYEAPDLGVASYVVNGQYRRGTTRDNPIEADWVVDRLVFHREHHPELSIGVVTFSAAQEQAISAAIERRAEDEPILAGLLDEHDRLTGFFVKNLENVQGDERDMIIFSVGYGPDEHGKLLMNFGPVTRAGGWRRLNVAITRARRRVEVVSSFRAGEIREGANESLAHLKGYLDFAARGMPAIATDIDDSNGGPESPFEEDVLGVLSSWGYDVATQVGSAGYRIDLAIRHPDRPGEYVLAVECDGAAYHAAASARDRDRLRAAVLRGLGWRIHRIWGISWYRDRVNESRKLKAAVEAAVSGADDVTTLQTAPTPVQLEIEEVDFDAPPDWAVEYAAADLASRRTFAELGDVEARPALQAYLAKVLAAEAPVHRDLVYRRVRDAFGVGRVGSKIKANIDFVANRLTIDGERVSVDSNGFFRSGGLKAVRVPASEEDIRTVSQTPPEEMDLAVMRLVSDAVTIDDERLVIAIRQLFGWRRAGGDIQVGVAAAVDRCVSSGRLSRTAGGTLRVAP